MSCEQTCFEQSMVVEPVLSEQVLCIAPKNGVLRGRPGVAQADNHDNNDNDKNDNNDGNDNEDDDDVHNNNKHSDMLK